MGYSDRSSVKSLEIRNPTASNLGRYLDALGCTVHDLASVATIIMAGAVTFTAVVANRQLLAIGQQVSAANGSIQEAQKQRSLEFSWKLQDALQAEKMQECLERLRSIPQPITAQALDASDENGRTLRRLLNFFEMVAVSVEREYVRFDDVAAYLGSDVLEFWSGVSDAVPTLRKMHHRPRMFQSFEAMARRLEKEHGYTTQ